MNKKIYMKPSKPSLIAGMVAVGLMLIFGVVFLFLMIDEESMVGILFLSFWILVMILLEVIFIYNYRNPNKSISEEIIISDEDKDDEETESFDKRLRRLESLYKERLISQNEYKQKRDEIMKSKW